MKHLLSISYLKLIWNFIEYFKNCFKGNLLVIVSYIKKIILLWCLSYTDAFLCASSLRGIETITRSVCA